MLNLLGIGRLILCAFIILPTVSLIRQVSYLVTSTVLGAKNQKITIGCGPILFRFWLFEIRKYYFMYSWCNYEGLKNYRRIYEVIIYAAPIFANLIVAVLINYLVSNQMIGHSTFWNQFTFYALYFILFDVIPLYYPDGQPSNGKVILELIFKGKKPEYKGRG